MKKNILCGVLALALCALSGCGKETVVPELLEPVGVAMDTATVEIGDMYSMTVYNGEIVPYVEEVSFPLDGKLKEFKVDLGDIVEKGQLLVKLDDEAILEQISKLEEEVADIITMGNFSDRKMAANIEIAKEQLEMLEARKSSDDKIKSKKLEIELKELELREAQELRDLKVGRLNKQVEKLRKDAVNTELRAPISGKIVYTSEAAVGDRVKGFATVVCIADEDRLSISSEYITPTTIKNAHKITAQIAGEEHEVTYVPFSDTEYITLMLSGKEVKSKFTLNDEHAEVESGQYVALKIWNMYLEDVLTIPTNALHRDEKGRYVYKIVDGERVRCNITVGATNDVEAEIVEGLQAGDVIYVKEEAMLAPDNANYKTAQVEVAEYVLTSQGAVDIGFPKAMDLCWDTEGTTMKELLVEKGQEVKAGEVLMTFEVATDEIALEELEIQLLRKQEDFARKKDVKEVELAEAEEETEEIQNEHSYRIAVLNVEKQRIDYEQYVYETEKSIKMLQEKITEKKETVANNKLVAPFDGVIASIVYFSEDEAIEVGEKLISMYKTDAVVLKVNNADEKLRYNMEVLVEITSIAKAQPRTGRVVSAPNILPADLQQDYARIVLDEEMSIEDYGYRGGPGGRGFGFTFKLEYSAEYQELQNVLVVDKNALQRDEGKNFVYVLEDGVVHKRFVSVGLSNKNHAWILDGLSEGQSLILD